MDLLMTHVDLTYARLLRRTVLGLVSATLLVGSLSANAAVITHSIDFVPLGEIRGSEPRLDFQALLPRFDPTLGTLRQVDINYNFDLNLNVSILNRTLTAQTVVLGPTSLRVEGPRFFDRFNFNNLVVSEAIDLSLDVPAGTRRQIGSINLTLPGRASADIAVDRRFSRTSRPLTIRNIVLRPQGNVTPFIGDTEMLLDFTAFTAQPLALPNSGDFLTGVRSSTSFTLDGSVDVSYDFLAAAPPVDPTPAPAPATLSLGLAGLLGLGLFKRRRGARSA